MRLTHKITLHEPAEGDNNPDRIAKTNPHEQKEDEFSQSDDAREIHGSAHGQKKKHIGCNGYGKYGHGQIPSLAPLILKIKAIFNAVGVF